MKNEEGKSSEEKRRRKWGEQLDISKQTHEDFYEKKLKQKNDN